MEKTHQKHAKKPRTQLRKKEYQIIDEEWIKNFLRQGTHATLATVYEDQPFITPVLYLYLEEDHALFFHGARTGRLRANLDTNPKVAFNVAEFGRILAHQDASEFNVTYNSVTVFGITHLVEDTTKNTRVLNQLLKKYAPQLEPGKDYHHIQPNELKITAVYQIDIQEWSGKTQIETPEYLDSFEYSPSN